MTKKSDSEYYNLFLRACTSKGLYSGIFKEESSLRLLSYLEKFGIHCFTTLWNAVQNHCRSHRLSSLKASEMMIQALKTVETWNSHIQEEEARHAIQRFPDIEALYKISLLNYLKHILKDRHKDFSLLQDTTIGVKIPPFRDFLFAFIKFLSNDPLVITLKYFQGEYVTERKMVHEDAMRDALALCLQNRVTYNSTTTYNKMDSLSLLLDKEDPIIRPSDSVSQVSLGSSKKDKDSKADNEAEKPNKKTSAFSNAVKTVLKHKDLKSKAVSNTPTKLKSNLVIEKKSTDTKSTDPQPPEKKSLFARELQKELHSKIVTPSTSSSSSSKVTQTTQTTPSLTQAFELATSTLKPDVQPQDNKLKSPPETKDEQRTSPVKPQTASQPPKPPTQPPAQVTDTSGSLKPPPQPKETQSTITHASDVKEIFFPREPHQLKTPVNQPHYTGQPPLTYDDEYMVDADYYDDDGYNDSDLPSTADPSSYVDQNS